MGGARAERGPAATQAARRCARHTRAAHLHRRLVVGARQRRRQREQRNAGSEHVAPRGRRRLARQRRPVALRGCGAAGHRRSARSSRRARAGAPGAACARAQLRPRQRQAQRFHLQPACTAGCVRAWEERTRCGVVPAATGDVIDRATAGARARVRAAPPSTARFVHKPLPSAVRSPRVSLLSGAWLQLSLLGCAFRSTPARLCACICRSGPVGRGRVPCLARLRRRQPHRRAGGAPRLPPSAGAL